MMSLTSFSRRQRITLQISMAYVLGFFLMLVFRPGSKDTFETLYFIGTQCPHLFAALGCFACAFRGHHASRLHKIGWQLLGVTCVLYLLGDVLFISETIKTNGRVPFPGPSDAAWIGLFPFLIVGLLLLSAKMSTPFRVRLLLDSAIVTSSVGSLSWYFVVQRLWNRSGIPLEAKLVSVCYPLIDVVCVFCALAMLNSLRRESPARRAYTLLAGGIFLWSFSDILYSFARFQAGFTPGSWFDFGWPFGALLIGFASRLLLWFPASSQQSEKSVQSFPLQAVPPWKMMLPYFAVGASLLIIVTADYAEDGKINSGSFWVALGMMVLLLLRQVLTLSENKNLTQEVTLQLEQNAHLNRRLVGMNETLEGEVKRRTEQLSALLRLTQSVNSTLVIPEVIRLSLEHTRTALQADGVLLRLDVHFRTEVISHLGFEAMPETLDFLLSCEVSEREEEFACPSPASPLHFPSGTGVWMPLLWNQQPMGRMAVVFHQRFLESTDRELLRSIGIEVGTSLENALQYQLAVEAADRDPVTGLYNHRAIHQVIDTQLAQAKNSNEPFTLCLIDLDNFKRFNETYGHMVGDEVLRSIAGAIGEICGGDSAGARYGGDEFLLLLPGSDTASALEMGAKLQKYLAHHGFRRDGEERIVPVSLSIGLASYPQDGDTRHDLLILADKNMYEAKRSSGGLRSTSEIQRVTRELQSDRSFSVLDAMVTAVDNKDSYTRKHSEDVTEYALWIAEEVGASPELLQQIRVGGLLHDVGKIGVPSDILLKPGRLTQEEYEILKRHTLLGALIVGSIPEMADMVEAVRSHHERWDGRGYPDATAGEATPMLGRILGVADAFSAMTTDRPYRRGIARETALEEIRAHTGSQFDPQFAEALIEAVLKRCPDLKRPAGASQAELPKAA